MGSSVLVHSEKKLPILKDEENKTPINFPSPYISFTEQIQNSQ